MTPLEISKLIVADLDSRRLKKPNIRKNALKRVLEYMRQAGEFLVDDSIVLPYKKDDCKDRLARIKGDKLTSSESSVINMIYYYVGGSSCMPDIQTPSTPQLNITNSAKNQVSSLPNGLDEIENKLIRAKFMGVNELNNDNNLVPNCPGVYCIKIRKGVTLPREFGIIRDDGIIYIGKASGSLRERLWEEELNHRKAATFFRSVGAVLGFLPPKGSLVNKKNKTNYRFSEDDTQKIIEWMRNSLLVNFIEVNPIELEEIEKCLIRKYKPLLNIKVNPTPSLALEAARKRCIDIANQKP